MGTVDSTRLIQASFMLFKDIGADEQNSETIQKHICSVCGLDCKYNKFCTHMFNVWVVHKTNITAFVDIVTALAKNRKIKNSIETLDMRTRVCDTCFLCKTLTERRKNTVCNLAWFAQFFGNTEQTYTTNNTINTKSSVFCTNGVMKYF